MMKKMLIINAGSSSIKWVLFNDNLTIDAKGRIQRIKMKQSILELSFEDKNYEEAQRLKEISENAHLEVAENAKTTINVIRRMTDEAKS